MHRHTRLQSSVPFIYRVLFAVVLWIPLSSNAQYTDIINSNRPGESTGAYSVGLGVYQIESGVNFDRQRHSLLETTYNSIESSNSIRMGFLLENLELSYNFSYLAQYDTAQWTKGVSVNRLGLKLLLLDPYKDRKVDVYSWKTNNGFILKNLIPAVSFTAIYSKFSATNPFNSTYPEEYAGFLMSTQQHLTPYWVMVSNFILDKSEMHREKSIIISLTHAFKNHQNWSAFIEGQSIINDYYSDEIIRTGAAYLWNSNLQFDGYFGINFKDTPTRKFVSLGISYRLDFNKNNPIN